MRVAFLYTADDLGIPHIPPTPTATVCPRYVSDALRRLRPSVDGWKFTTYILDGKAVVEFRVIDDQIIESVTSIMERSTRLPESRSLRDVVEAILAYPNVTFGRCMEEFSKGWDRKATRFRLEAALKETNGSLHTTDIEKGYITYALMKVFDENQKS